MKILPFVTVHANDIDAFIPEFWANESLAILEENMVMAQLVHRDFEPIIQNFGDVINTRRPGTFVAKRKTNADPVTVQDANATNVQVPLNQQVHVSFLIKDGEESKSMKSLIDEYMAPAMLAQAQFIDKMLLGQVYQFLANSYGPPGGLSKTNSIDAITGVRNRMNKNKAYVMGRNLVLTPNSETLILNNPNFLAANYVGDDGTALRTASLGQKLGFDIFMCQNACSISAATVGTTGGTVAVGAVNNAAGYPTGTTTMTVDGLSAAIANGSWFTVAGDPIPHLVSSTVGGATPTSIVFTPALSQDVLDNAIITSYTGGAVNQAVSPTGYAAGWSKEIVVNNFTVAVSVGQLITFGTATNIYSVIAVNGLTGITLDRPLDVAIANGAVVNPGPKGDFNFAFHRNAVSLVVRPLAQPRAGTGALSAVVNMNGLSMRATITYDGTNQGHLVTLDMLCGFAILDVNLGAVLLG